MKKCPYCGQEYPDEATECATDQTALISGVERKKVTGVWRGVYGYSERWEATGIKPAHFTLKLKQGWTSHFSGSVTEDPPIGCPETGTIDGYFGSPSIDFTKRMPVGYIYEADGTRQTLREFLAAAGRTSNLELPSPPILYNGTFLDSRRVQGTWMLTSVQIPLPDGPPFSTGQTTGYWCAEFVTDDLNANPTGGPAAALFDKNLLTPEEVERVEGTPYNVLGKFNVVDAQNLMDRLTQAGLRLNVRGNDEAMQKMMPFTVDTGGYSGAADQVEIFVHPDDEEEAKKIVFGEDQAREVEPN
jgi:hypothetical protein